MLISAFGVPAVSTVYAALSAISGSCIITGERSPAPTCSAPISHRNPLHGSVYDTTIVLFSSRSLYAGDDYSVTLVLPFTCVIWNPVGVCRTQIRLANRLLVFDIGTESERVHMIQSKLLR